MCLCVFVSVCMCFCFCALSAFCFPPFDTKVVEALMCIVSDRVSQKRVTYKVESGDMVARTVLGEASCRRSTPADWNTLADYRCLSKADESQGAGKVRARQRGLPPMKKSNVEECLSATRSILASAPACVLRGWLHVGEVGLRPMYERHLNRRPHTY